MWGRLRFGFTKVNTRMAKYPLATAVAVGGFKNISCDLMVQKVVEQRETIDWKRLRFMAVFGVLYLGFFQYKFLVQGTPHFFGIASKKSPTVAELRAYATKVVLFDNFFHMPFMYLPTFFMLRELSCRDHGTWMQYVDGSLTSWKNAFANDVALSLAIFTPVQAFNFYVLPPHLRIPSLMGAGFVYITALSILHGNVETEKIEAKS